MWRGGLSERRIAPFGCEAVANLVYAVCLAERGLQVLGLLRSPTGASPLATAHSHSG
jgi:hypothetical protein